jgi:23S rRNA pseudouridine2605 synthase
MIKPERVQKILSQLGVCSRRKAEELIENQEVTVNGKIATLGTKALYPGDAIKVKGKLCTTSKNFVTLVFYKPKSVVSTLSDPTGRATLKDFLGKAPAKVYPVGRLDFNSEGLMILTNNGDLAEQIQKDPHLTRTYEVKIKGYADQDTLKRIQGGARIGRNQRRLIKPTHVAIKRELQSKTVIEVTFQGSGSMNIKELFEIRGLLVEKMVRTKIGSLSLASLKPGEWKILNRSVVQKLFYHD